MSNLKFVSLNARGLRGNKRHTVFNWLREKDIDVCLLQETFCTVSFSKTFNRGWSGTSHHSCSNSSHSKGVCILFNKNLKHKVISTHRDKEGRFLLVNVSINNTDYSICNIYCPNDMNSRIVFIHSIIAEIKANSISPNNLILGGDFNCIQSVIDRENGILDKSSDALMELKNTLSLKDAWRQTNPDTVQYTYIDPSARGRNSRIDAILLSASIMPWILSSEIIQAPAPDHKAVTVVLKSTENTRGKGFWKLNNSLLYDKEYEEGIRDLIQEINNEYGDIECKTILWDYLKIRVKSFSIAYSVRLASKKKLVLQELEEKLNEIDSIPADRQSNETRVTRNKLKNELDELYTEKAKGYQIRSRAKWVQDGEKSTAYFLNLEKSRQSSNAINSLKDEAGAIQHSDADILRIINTFYSNLYTSKKPSLDAIDAYLQSIPPNDHVRLSDSDMQHCEGHVRLDECTYSLKQMKGNRSPGIDGLSVEFYTKFWDMLGPMLTNTFNESYDTGLLSESQRKAVLTLIFKKGAVDDINNYRPISVTNIDYKILAMVLANRMQNVISSVVSPDQTAYIKGRYMGTNIRLVNDILDYYDSRNLSGMLLSLDFTKAFDTIEHDFMFKALEWFGFGQSFIKWINTLYNNPSACVKNNGYLTHDFALTCGIRQGCPISAILFILCVEVLAIKVRSDKNLNGFHFGNEKKNVKLSQYADDTILCLNNDTETLHAFSIVEAFGRVSGLELNRSKCEGYWLGSSKDQQQNCTKYGIKWPLYIKHLGICIGYDHQENLRMNWLVKVEKIESILKQWSKRDLSLLGKIQIIKTFALSQVALPASTLPVPDYIINKLNHIGLLFKFLWNSKDKVKRIKVIKSTKQGGLGMVDIESYFQSIKANWINRIKVAHPDIHSWVQIPAQLFSTIDLKYDELEFNFDNTVNFPALQSLPDFYKEAVQFYNKVYASNFNDFTLNIRNEIIWGNKFITNRTGKKKDVLFLRDWIRSGVRRICDLRFNDGVLDENYTFDKIRNKRNIYVQMAIVKKALLPYRNIIRNTTNIHQRIANTQISHTCMTTQQFYRSIVAMKTLGINPISNYIYAQGFTCNEDDMFECKVYNETEVKLKEYNFKLLHGILPCNVNLKRWHLKDSDTCDTCNLPQSIKHLLFDCNYVQPLWIKINDIFNTNVTYKLLLGINQSFELNNVLTLVSFLIYKDWLLHSLENKHRRTPIALEYFRAEFQLRVNIYKKSSIIKEHHIIRLERLIEFL